MSKVFLESVINFDKNLVSPPIINVHKERTSDEAIAFLFGQPGKNHAAPVDLEGGEYSPMSVPKIE